MKKQFHENILLLWKFSKKKQQSNIYIEVINLYHNLYRHNDIFYSTVALFNHYLFFITIFRNKKFIFEFPFYNCKNLISVDCVVFLWLICVYNINYCFEPFIRMGTFDYSICIYQSNVCFLCPKYTFHL